MDNINKLFHLLLSVAPQKGDVIVWLQGDRYDRGTKVLDLYVKKMAKKIVLTGNNVLLSSKLRLGEKNISLQSMYNWLVKKGVKKKDIIVESKSLNTKDQADNVIALSKKNKWSKLLLVASSYHQPRAFLTFLYSANKFDWNGLIINQPFFVDENKIPGGRSEVSGKLFLKEIKKISFYKKDLATLNEGLKYIYDNFIRVKLKLAKLEDANFLFELRNDATIRSNSFNQEEIKIDGHVSWFKKVLVDKNIFLYIIFNETNEKIGQVRFDIVKKHTKISISIGSSFRNMGYGREVITVSSLFFLNKFVNMKYILAEIKKENLASIKSFVKSGYVFFKENDNTLFLHFNNKINLYASIDTSCRYGQ
ncbi:MAG: hypothetical protein A2493_01850 [Candidatus Magasanikbacteria bacterium RIFOXYC12_FULL_33_11]|uniref:N-acetyltransferase domain-containing protein n=1 Tax=Candidatus Magasanikbacteria bacterium RIFOXYC12_FULL_33_11 TaxID=1798701 RepID=A0A1F6NMS7_9BACT|nr:MAG: hypothetical protein A2493_01850 [Candidatus Magasanikbacteria bacterium RIFOXYC12_FULL_33_11]